MFTGIIERVGKIEAVKSVKGGVRFLVNRGEGDYAIALGDSVAVDGACLTATGFERDAFLADASPETLKLTTLGSLKPGSEVNLERAVALGGRLGGHIVSGHVDGLATLKSKQDRGEFVELRLAIPKELLKYVAIKGSAAICGISLTINSVKDDGIVGLTIIPHTINNTTLKNKRPGDALNFEVDVLARYVERLMSAGGANGQDSEKDKKLIDLLVG